MMARTAGRSVALVAMMVAVLGCGGSGSTTPGADASTGTTPTEAPQPSDAAVPSEPVAGGGGGGACDLVTADELAAIFGVDGVKSTLIPGPPDTCAVDSTSGETLVAWVLTTESGKMIFEAIALPGQSTDVSGVGDRAALVDNTGLVVLKGDKLLTIGVTNGTSGDELLELAKQIGAKAAGRM